MSSKSFTSSPGGPPAGGAGFSLVEVVIASVIVAALATGLIINFRSSAKSIAGRHRAAAVFTADVRRAQELALAGSRFNNNLVCGYGLAYVNPTAYTLFAAALPGGGASCASRVRKFQAGDYTVGAGGIENQSIEFKSSFKDIYFEIPDPKTFIDGANTLTPPTFSRIEIGYKGEPCIPTACTTIKVHTTSQVEVEN